MQIELQTSTGDFVTEAEILPFTSYPDVVIWGERVFKQHHEFKYRECFFCIAHPTGKFQ
jgi:hypothetical protein